MQGVILVLGLLFPLGVAAMILPPLLGNAPPGAQPGSAAGPSPAPRASRVAPDVAMPRVEVVPTLAPPPTRVPSPPPRLETAAPSATAASQRTFTVRPGDELRQIAASNGVTIAAIMAQNDIPNPDSLRVGQVLKIPDPP